MNIFLITQIKTVNLFISYLYVQISMCRALKKIKIIRDPLNSIIGSMVLVIYEAINVRSMNKLFL